MMSTLPILPIASTRPGARPGAAARARAPVFRWVGTALLGVAVILLAGCSDAGGGGDGSDAGSNVGDGGGSPDDGGALPDGSSGPCSLGQSRCLDTEREQVCLDVGGVPTWTEQACGVHRYCLTDHCEAACVDECAWGETRSSGGQQQTCRLYSESAQAFVQPGGGTHDLARLHGAFTRHNNLANGYVCETLFTDTTYATPMAYLGTVDAAEWTGTYLAAEALRLMTTRSPDAERNLEQQVERACELFEITGEPGYMARIWVPLGVDPLFDAMYDAADFSHHQTTFGGGSAFWHGWTSRDMYAGALLGLSLAYDALTSEVHRALIRDAVVTLAMELVAQRTGVPVRVRFNFMGSWQEQTLTFDLEHVVLVPSEMVNGAVFVQVGTEADPSDYGSSELVGAREFFPDFADMLSQVPLIGSLVPSVPRPSSAMMLAHFLRTALQVTDGVPGYASERAAIEAHYLAHVDDWIALMEQYTFHNASECWKQTFGLTIAYHSMYGLIRLEPDPTRRQAMQQALGTRMWEPVATHKNPYFGYASAAQGLASLLSPAELQNLGAQLGQFGPPPKARVLVDNTGAYPADPDCPGQTTVPIDVATRVPTDFLWQHHPFQLVTPEPEPRLVFAAADYLLAYWLGRHHGYLADDAADTCLRWDP